MESRELMQRLIEVDGVTDVELHWSPALEVRVHLASMDWDARAVAIGQINTYVNTRPAEDNVPVSATFSFPDPTEFTRYKATV